MTRHVHLLAAASCLLPPAAANGQSPPCARPAFERVARMEGRWRVDWSTPAAQGRMRRTVAAAEITAVIPQCALLERFTGTVEDSPFRSAVVLTVQDTVRRGWIDSNHGEPVVPSPSQGRQLVGEASYRRERGS